MGWECPKCARCYAPTVEVCPTCPEKISISKEVVDALGKVSLSGGSIGDASATVTTTHGNTSISYACTSFVKQGTSKYCANCGSHEKNHLIISY